MSDIEKEEKKLLQKVFMAASDYKMACNNSEFAEKNGGKQKLLVDLLRVTTTLEIWYGDNVDDHSL